MAIHGFLRLRSFHEVLTVVARGMVEEPEFDVAPDPVGWPPMPEDARSAMWSGPLVAVCRSDTNLQRRVCRTDTPTAPAIYVRSIEWHCRACASPRAPSQLGTILAAGLTLGHYESFRTCPGLGAMRTRMATDWPRQIAHGVHVLVSQHDGGHLVLGDSHEYDDAITPFDRRDIDDLVLDYLRTFLQVEPLDVEQRWHGIYVKHPNEPYCIVSPEDGVAAVAGLGGHGMTLSFALAEQVVASALA
jgi:hypothetical protein